jgi:hypothetical protein
MSFLESVSGEMKCNEMSWKLLVEPLGKRWQQLAALVTRDVPSGDLVGLTKSMRKAGKQENMRSFSSCFPAFLIGRS